MEDDDQVGRRLCFGVFELDLRTAELRKRGLRVRLQEQPFQVLAMLLERAGQVVGREELQKKLWPADTFVDFDHGLNKAINKIREALGDSAESPRFVETVARRGYRFIADVRVADAAPARSPEPEPQPHPAPDPSDRRTVAGTPATLRRRRPLRAWTLSTAALLVLLISLAAWKLHSYAPPSSVIRSLAVLPLESLSSDASQDYFADGMTDELITDLGQISALRVISRTSVMAYKHTRKSLPQIARELNVDAVVEGTVLRSGDKVRITAQLIEGSADRHLWSQSYQGELRDTLALQNTVARAIADQIRINVNPQEQAALRNVTVVNPTAYTSYLKGRYFWNKRTPADLDTAARYFQQAIEKDPAYALAYSGLADSHHYMGYAFGRTPPKEAMPKAKAAALKALELDESLAEAHASLGLVKFVYDWDWAGAESEFKRAIELKPNYPSAHHFYSVYLANVLGRFDEAIAEAKRGLELDPLSININNIVALHLFNAGRYDEAIEQRRKMLEMDPQSADAHYQLGEAYAAKGLYQKAFDEHMQALVLWGKKEPMEEYRQAYATSGWNGYRLKLAQRSLESLLAEWQKGSLRNIEASVIVESYIQLGEKDKAFEWLGKMFEARDGMLIWLKVNPNYDRLRSDPRFTDLVRRVGLSL